MGKSSKDKRDAYYRLAKEQGWRARSAFKLIQLDEQFNLFEGVHRVVDLCAAPGSWSQVLSRVLIKGEKFGRRAWEEKHARTIEDFEAVTVGASQTTTTTTMTEEAVHEVKTEARGGSSNSKDERSSLPLPSSAPTVPQEDGSRGGEQAKEQKTQRRENVRIVAVDLQPMSPLEGITTLVGDITHPSTIPRILAALDPELQEDDDDDNKKNETTSITTTDGQKQQQRQRQRQRQPVDLVVSDGAPDVTGLHDLDTYVQAQLLFSALDLAVRVLRPGGAFVAKIFRARDVDLIYAQLRCFFDDVRCAKPRSSRASSLEAFVVCRGFRLPKGYEVVDDNDNENDDDDDDARKQQPPPPLGQDATAASLKAALESEHAKAAEEKGKKAPFVNGIRRVLRDDGVVELEFEDDEAQANRWIAPFVACGDLSAFDSDATYHLPKDHVSLDPVQPPTAPPYKRALENRRQEGGFYGPTGKKGNTSL